MAGDVIVDTIQNPDEGIVAEGLLEIRRALGKNASAVLEEIEEGEILGIERKDFISAPGFNADLDEPDGHLFTVELPAGQKLIVLNCRRSENPFALMPGGADRREWEAWTYLFDGTETITVTGPDGRKSTYSGEPGGNPAKLIEYLTSEPMLGRPLFSGRRFTK